ncbi:MAG: hypothetical protein QM308_08255 [Bacillota bacterium]|nr:hypothetical protein [Bacillota bacterium]
MRDQILILDFEPSYSAYIASKLRAERISARIIPGETSAESIMNQEVLGVILSGGIHNEALSNLDAQLLRCGIPVLALGSAAGVVNALLGGHNSDVEVIEGVDTIVFHPSKITNGLTESERQFGSIVTFSLGNDIQELATYQGKSIGFFHKSLAIYAVSSQLEPNDPDMMSLLMQFATDICGCTRWWNDDTFISIAKGEIQEAAGEGKALCVMSGGLDSGVTALLAHRALGSRLTCLFIDNGLLRENDVVEFSSYYKSVGLNLVIVDAADEVMEALKGLTVPSEKRATLQKVIKKVINEAADKIDFQLLIESGSSDYLFSGKKKPDAFSILENPVNWVAPLRDLFKEEIRQVGLALGMPPEMTMMQPFPWSGLALRIGLECTREKIGLLRRADHLFQQSIKDAGLQKRMWKYFVLLDESSHRQDERRFILSLRAVSMSHTGKDLRAIPARLPYDLLERYTQTIMETEPQVCSVSYDLTPGVIVQECEWQ